MVEGSNSNTVVMYVSRQVVAFLEHSTPIAPSPIMSPTHAVDGTPIGLDMVLEQQKKSVEEIMSHMWENNCAHIKDRS